MGAPDLRSESTSAFFFEGRLLKKRTYMLWKKAYKKRGPANASTFLHQHLKFIYLEKHLENTSKLCRSFLFFAIVTCRTPQGKPPPKKGTTLESIGGLASAAGPFEDEAMEH